MGKGDKAKEAAKKAAKAARVAAKTAKGSAKRAGKAASGLGLDEAEEDIAVIMASLAAADARKTAVTVVELPAGGRPPHRANASLTF